MDCEVFGWFVWFEVYEKVDLSLVIVCFIFEFMVWEFYRDVFIWYRNFVDVLLVGLLDLVLLLC